jgi:hypothetical protein
MPGKVKDYTGHRFGRLTVIAYAGSVSQGTKGHTGSAWKCLCDCGEERIVRRKSLTEGNTKSCGCLQREVLSKSCTTHGKSHTRTWNIWSSMKSRCGNPNTSEYSAYGGRGIVVCDRWKQSFAAFYQDMGECPPGYSIERVNVNGNYEPANCKWIPLQAQHDNKQCVRFAILNGQRMRLRQADKILGRKLGYLSNWYMRGKEPPHIPNLKFEW